MTISIRSTSAFGSLAEGRLAMTINRSESAPRSSFAGFLSDAIDAVVLSDMIICLVVAVY